MRQSGAGAGAGQGGKRGGGGSRTTALNSNECAALISADEWPQPLGLCTGHMTDIKLDMLCGARAAGPAPPTLPVSSGWLQCSTSGLGYLGLRTGLQRCLVY